jgi:hypothetical protein
MDREVHMAEKNRTDGPKSPPPLPNAVVNGRKPPLTGGIQYTQDKITTRVRLLVDSKPEIRKAAAEFLANAAADENFRMMVLSELTNAITSDLLARSSAHEAIRKAGKLGVDVSPAVGMMAKNLADYNPKVRRAALQGLIQFSSDGIGIQDTVPALAAALSDEDPGVRGDAGEALVRTAEKGADVLRVMPALIAALSDSEKIVKINVIRAVGNASRKGIDTSSAASEIGRILLDENNDVRHYAVITLTAMAKARIDITSELVGLARCAVSDADERVRAGAASALREAAEKGLDISAAVPMLGAALLNPLPGTRDSAAEALGTAGERGCDISPAVPAALKGISEAHWNDGGEGAAGALASLAERCEYKVRTLIISEIILYTRTDKFQDDMWVNAPAYERAAKAVSMVLERLMKSEWRADLKRHLKKQGRP